MYKSFSIKYRPRQLSEIGCQEILVSIINNAIIFNKISKAYLFSGTRGIGKTSTARIIANTINCTNQIIKEGKVYSCQKCKNCLAFLSNAHPDIIEIDAASNTGVDNIRTIIEDANYKPTLGKHKVYIIDEVHMLSKSAFNAFLKILEEPPENIVFILATTEPNKLPITIISRCQTFELNSASKKDLVQFLKDFCTKERIVCSDEALEIISKNSSGSIRDALSLLEKAYIMSISKEEITKINEELLLNITNSANASSYLQIIRDILSLNSINALHSLAKLNQNNIEALSSAHQLLEIMSNICKTKIIQDNKNDNVEFNDYIEICNKEAKKYSIPTLLLGWQILLKSISYITNSPCKNLTLEMVIIEIICAFQIDQDQYNIPTLNAQDNKTIALNATNSNSIQDKLLNYSFNESDLFAILTHLQKERMFDLYYYLMNEVEIISLCKNSLHIKTNKINKEISHAIEKAISEYNNSSFKVTVESTSNNLTSIKKQMIKKLEESRTMSEINKYFPQAKIKDILFED